MDNLPLKCTARAILPAGDFGEKFGLSSSLIIHGGLPGRVLLAGACRAVEKGCSTSLGLGFLRLYNSISQLLKCICPLSFLSYGFYLLLQTKPTAAATVSERAVSPGHCWSRKQNHQRDLHKHKTQPANQPRKDSSIRRDPLPQTSIPR
jgi:hypothetical protein